LDDFKNFGIDVEQKLMEMLSNELAKNIDADIMKNLGIIDRVTLRKEKIKRISEKLK
jgi:hypothetical protein